MCYNIFTKLFTGGILMKKVSLRIISVMLSLLMFISLLPVGLAEGDVPADDVPADNTGFTDEDFLTVKGTKIYNRKGEEIILQGVNLGGWLIQEDWLWPL